MGSGAEETLVEYTVPARSAAWEREPTRPSSVAHDRAVTLLKDVLNAWARHRPNTLVARNLATRWDPERAKAHVAPDICVFSTTPVAVEALASLRTWEGHEPPTLAVEILNDAAKGSYGNLPDRYAASGVRELWVFDPLLSGPTAHGGPHRLQVWDRDETGSFVRRYAGEGPVRSPLLDAYLVVVHEGRKLRIAEDREGTRFWTTAEEAERAAKEAERAAKEAERAAKEAALARIAELEAELAKRG